MEGLVWVIATGLRTLSSSGKPTMDWASNGSMVTRI
jgi:hypothetical protein